MIGTHLLFRDWLTMSHFDEEAVRNLSKLCRIEYSDEEVSSLVQDLEKIVTYVELLQEVDTENVSPCNHVLSEMTNVMREDEVGETLSRDIFLSNAPSQVGGMIKVPPVIKSHSS